MSAEWKRGCLAREKQNNQMITNQTVLGTLLVLKNKVKDEADGEGSGSQA